MQRDQSSSHPVADFSIERRYPPVMEYTVQREIDEKGTQIVKDTLIEHGWAMFVPNLDIRIDYDIEPRRNREPTGDRTAVQQKAALSIPFNKKSGATFEGLEVQHIKYWVDDFKRPVFLVCVDVTAKKWWWLFIQEYMLETYPKAVKKDWRKQKTITIHIPANQNFENFSLLEKALFDSYGYMAKRWPMSIQEHLLGLKSKLAKIDPNFNVTVQSTELGFSFHLTPTLDPVPLSLHVKIPDRKRAEEIAKEMLGRGKPVTFAPGEVAITGSPLFSREVFGEIVKLHFAASSTQDVYIVIPGENGEADRELTFSGARLEGGPLEVRIVGSVFGGLVALNGTWVKDRTHHRLSFVIDLSKWVSCPFADPPYLAPVAALVRAAIRKRELKLYLQRFDKRVFLGALPPLKKKSIEGWRELSGVIGIIERVKALANRLHFQPLIPQIIKNEQYELAKQIDDATDYRTRSAPYSSARTELVGIPTEGMKQIAENPIAHPATLRLQKEETRLVLFDQPLVVPAHTYIFTNMILKVASLTGQDSAFVEWKGNADTTITVERYDGPPLPVIS